MSELNYSTVVSELRQSFRRGVMKSLDVRLTQLKQLHRMFEEHEQEIYDAVYKDLRKHKTEANVVELLHVRIELGNAVKNLESWMKPERVSGDLLNKINTCEIRYDPLGVILMICPWNYPILIPFSPLVGALAAGNCVIIKPSELAPHSSRVFSNLINQYLSPDVIRVIEGGVPETTALLRERFDLIFFTGSTAVGKVIMRAAAEHLTPVVLELGGKSPVIVDDTCNMEVVAQRIAWAKFINSGATCIAPDYVICVGNIVEEFVEGVKKAVVKFYGENAQKSNSYGSMVNSRHFNRVRDMIDASKVVYGNVTDEKDLYISPTIMTNVTADDKIMEEEIFGPVMPIMQLDSIEAAINFINDREKPLALYAFTNNTQVVQQILDNTSSGGVCINDCLFHGAVPNLPFGGVGHSGMGKYHGKYGFQTFSHMKSCLHKSQMLEFVHSVRYPPYDPDWMPLKALEWAIKPSV